MNTAASTPNGSPIQQSIEYRLAKDLFKSKLKEGRSPNDAAFDLETHGMDKSLVLAIQLEVEQESLLIKGYGGNSVFDPSGDSWYFPGDDGQFFTNVRETLSKQLPADTVREISSTADEILGVCGNPQRAEMNQRGLVIGYVQSGKTTSFISLAAKAVDAGYKLIIILSGMTDNLRAQTQERVDQVLIGNLKSRWQPLTTVEHDFTGSTAAEPMLTPVNNQGVVAVVKKNPGRLRRLVKWLSSASSMTASTPILIIDDEADQATPNTAKARDRASRINGLLRKLCSFPKTTYVAYTATPFANLLMDTEAKDDLFPRDFIVSLPEPAGYMGTTQLFGRASLPDETERFDPLDVIRTIDSDEGAEILRRLKEKSPIRIPRASALGESIMWFLLATAARRARDGQAKHSSMLVNVSSLSDDHFIVQKAIDGFLRELRNIPDTELETVMRQLWQQQNVERASEIAGIASVDLDAAITEMKCVLDAATTIVDNYKSQERLQYSKDKPETVIVTGGNTMSRGLTLEGLIASYFLRTTKTYDTLLQMGRWFGFRPGYQDLPRVWMTDEMSSWFADLALIEAEVREQIRAFAPKLDRGKVIPGHDRPSEVAVKIRQHPSMSIVAPNKARHGQEVGISLSGARLQTTVFQSDDFAVLLDNQKAVRELVAAAQSNGSQLTTFASRRKGFTDLPADLIINFLHAYRFHPDSRRIDPSLIEQYVRKEMASDGLRHWNVVFEGSHIPPSQSRPTLDLGLSFPVTTVTRSRRSSTYGDANIGALVTENHRGLDLPADLGPDQATQEIGDSEIRRLRDQHGYVNGLIVIYPINKDSKYRGKGDDDGDATRFDLEAVEHVIGLAIYFPTAKGPESNIVYSAAKTREPLINAEEEAAVIAEALAADDYDENNALAEEKVDADGSDA